jgi:hypothetical protein
MVMKRIAYILVLTFSALSINAADITLIVNAFKEGKVSGITGNMDTEVDVAVPGTTKKGTGADAVAILTRFFESDSPTGFTVLHHADKNDTGFFVGRLTTGKGEFRVNITYVIKDNKVLIQSIRIE